MAHRIWVPYRSPGKLGAVAVVQPPASYILSQVTSIIVFCRVHTTTQMCLWLHSATRYSLLKTDYYTGACEFDFMSATKERLVNSGRKSIFSLLSSVYCTAQKIATIAITHRLFSECTNNKTAFDYGEALLPPTSNISDSRKFGRSLLLLIDDFK